MATRNANRASVNAASDNVETLNAAIGDKVETGRAPTEGGANETSDKLEKNELAWIDLENFVAIKAAKGLTNSLDAMHSATCGLALMFALSALSLAERDLPATDSAVFDYAENRVLAKMVVNGFMIYRNGKDPVTKARLTDSRDAVNAIQAENDPIKRQKLLTAYVKDFKTTSGEMGEKGKPLMVQKRASGMETMLSNGRKSFSYLWETPEAQAIIRKIAALPEMGEAAFTLWEEHFHKVFGNSSETLGEKLEAVYAAKVAASPELQEKEKAKAEKAAKAKADKAAAKAKAEQKATEGDVIRDILAACNHVSIGGLETVASMIATMIEARKAGRPEGLKEETKPATATDGVTTEAAKAA